jgi:uncharacterized membrane protein
MAETRTIAPSGGARLRRVLVAACLLLTGVPAYADPFPVTYARYRVTGVTAGDSLNVRDQPGPKASIAGQIAPGLDGILVSGVSEKIDGEVWWQVIASPASPVTGWVNSRYLELTKADRDSERGYPLACRGTEPFWAVDIAGGQAKSKLAMSEAPEKNWDASEWITPQGSSNWAFAVRLNAGDAQGYAAIKEEQACSDGMSDRNYPFYILLIDPAGDVFTGCCARR